jgi:hypothetical protein
MLVNAQLIGVRIIRHAHEYGVAILAAWDSPHFIIICCMAGIFLIGCAVFIKEA